MNILDLTTIYPNPVIDSEGRTVQGLDRALVRAGHHITTLVLRPWAPLWLARRIKQYRHLTVPNFVQDDQGVHVIFHRYLHIPWIFDDYRFPLNIRLMADQALRLYRRTGEHCDLIMAQGITAALAARDLATRLRVPFVIVLRDDLRHLANPHTRSLQPLQRQAFLQASAILMVGPGQMRQAADSLPAECLSKVTLAPNGIDVDQIRAIASSVPRQAEPFAGKIVSVSNLVRFKGIHENLAAMVELLKRGITHWYYTIVGDGPYRAELEKLTRELGLSAHVTFTGKLPHRQAIQAMCASDIFCLPSWMEAFGQVYAEAAVCGIPAIGCWENGAELIIHDGETGLLVPPRDVHALADALEFLLTHPDQARAMGTNAAHHAENLSWECAVQVYLRVFEKLA